MRTPDAPPQRPADPTSPQLSLPQLLALAVGALLAGVLHRAVLGGFTQIFSLGVGFPLFVLFLTTCWLGLSLFWKKPLNAQAYILLFPLLFFAVMVFVRASFVLTLVNVFWSFFLILVIARISFAERIQALHLGDYLLMFLLPFRFLEPATRTLSDLTSSVVQPLGQLGRSLEALRGLLMALPFLFLFTVLFIAADGTFAAFFQGMGTFDDRLLSTTLSMVFFSLFYLGAFSFVYRNRPEQSQDTPIASNQDQREKTISPLTGATLLGSVAILFLIFLLVQLRYLFGGMDNIHYEGFTFAEYTRRGFIELTLVGFITFFMLFLTEKAVLGTEPMHPPRYFKMVSGALVLLVLLIISSAFHRLYLYEQAYGLTETRFYGYVFVAFLISSFCWLLVKIFREWSDQRFALGVFVLTLLFLAGLNILNPDRFIAQRNIDRHLRGGEFDPHYLQRLSSDIVPALVPLLEDKNQTTRTAAANLLTYMRWQMVRDERPETFLSYHLSYEQAKAVFREHHDAIETNSSDSLQIERHPPKVILREEPERPPDGYLELQLNSSGQIQIPDPS